MAYETFNKAAVDKLVAERKQQRAVKQARSSGFWAGLFAVFDTLSRMGNNSNTSSELETESRRSDIDTPLHPLDSHYSVSHYERNSGLYSPMIGSRD